MTTKKVSRPATTTLNPDTTRAAFDLVEAKIRSITDDQILAVNTDLPTAVSIVLGAAPKIEALIPEMKRLGSFDIDNAKLLSTYAKAALHADVVAGSPNDAPFAEALAEATSLRRLMLVAAEPLADRGFVSADKLAEIKSGTGHVDTAHDVTALAELFESAWPQIHTKTVVTRVELDRAAKLGPDLLALIGMRRQNGNEDTLRTRERAFTVLANAYDECRRALTFLRWHEDDIDLIAPSLYARKRKRPTTDLPDEPVVVEPTPVVTPPEPPLPGLPELPLTD
jgi:hypothetical protein